MEITDICLKINDTSLIKYNNMWMRQSMDGLEIHRSEILSLEEICTEFIPTTVIPQNTRKLS